MADWWRLTKPDRDGIAGSQDAPESIPKAPNDHGQGRMDRFQGRDPRGLRENAGGSQNKTAKTAPRQGIHWRSTFHERARTVSPAAQTHRETRDWEQRPDRDSENARSGITPLATGRANHDCTNDQNGNGEDTRSPACSHVIDYANCNTRNKVRMFVLSWVIFVRNLRAF